MYQYTVVSLKRDVVQAMLHAIEEVIGKERETRGMVGDLGGLVDKLGLRADAIITPGNSYGDMSGTFDLAVRNVLGRQIETKVQQSIRTNYYGELTVGNAFVVPVDNIQVSGLWIKPPFQHVVYAPTMRIPKRIPRGSDAVYSSVLAALQSIGQHNQAITDFSDVSAGIERIVLTAHGHGTGAVPIDVIAKQTAMAIEQFEKQIHLGENINWVERDREIHGILKTPRYEMVPGFADNGGQCGSIYDNWDKSHEPIADEIGRGTAERLVRHLNNQA